MRAWLFAVLVLMASYVDHHARLALAQTSFKMGMLAPWTGTFEDASALTSASAVSLAIEAVHADPTLGDNMQLR